MKDGTVLALVLTLLISAIGGFITFSIGLCSHNMTLTGIGVVCIIIAGACSLFLEHE